jgi:hypothetical protein
MIVGSVNWHILNFGRHRQTTDRSQTPQNDHRVETIGGSVNGQNLNFWHHRLTPNTCLWSFSGVCGLSVVCMWCPKLTFCQFTFPPIVSTLSVDVFRCLWSACGLSVVPKVQILSIYTSSYRFHPVCGCFQVSVVCLLFVCGA